MDYSTFNARRHWWRTALLDGKKTKQQFNQWLSERKDLPLEHLVRYVWLWDDLEDVTKHPKTRPWGKWASVSPRADKKTDLGSSDLHEVPE